MTPLYNILLISSNHFIYCQLGVWRYNILLPIHSHMFVFYNFLAYWLSASLENFQYFINKNLADSANIVLLKITYICILFSKIYIYLVGGEEPGRVPALRYRPTVLPGGEDIRHAGDSVCPERKAGAFFRCAIAVRAFLQGPLRFVLSRYFRTLRLFSRNQCLN